MGWQRDQRAPQLTDREREILRLLFEGLTNREMGARLHLSPLTIRNYVSQLLQKFEARNRTQLLARFIDFRRRYHRRLLP